MCGAGGPTWSPSGRWLLFASNRDKQAYVGQIFAVRPDDSKTRRLTDGKLSRALPSLSADGRRLCVYQNVETAEFEFGHIAIIAVDLRE